MISLYPHFRHSNYFKRYWYSLINVFKSVHGKFLRCILNVLCGRGQLALSMAGHDKKLVKLVLLNFSQKATSKLLRVSLIMAMLKVI